MDSSKDYNIDYLVINGTTYIPIRNDIELELVWQDKQSKLKQRNKEYYEKNKQKWTKYNESKKQRELDKRTVIEFK